ncbi:MAG: hypothetical protein ACTHKT_04365 [Solirubrobacterales bacterium]
MDRMLSAVLTVHEEERKEKGVVLTLSGRQRDLLYLVAIQRLTGIDQVWSAIEDQRWEEAQRLGREFADLLQLLVAGLGWGDATAEIAEAVRVEGSPDSLRRALETIRTEASVETEEQRDLRLRVAETEIDRRDTLEACDELLARLHG